MEKTRRKIRIWRTIPSREAKLAEAEDIENLSLSVQAVISQENLPWD